MIVNEAVKRKLRILKKQYLVFKLQDCCVVYKLYFLRVIVVILLQTKIVYYFY
nr:hypothetical protein [uncultured bacterium]